MKLLHIDSSILGEQSASRTVSREIVARWKKAVPGIEVEHLDLVANELPHLTGHHLAQMQVPESRDAQVLADFNSAYDGLAGQPCDQFLTGTLAGVTLTPGVYCFAAAATLTALSPN